MKKPNCYQKFDNKCDFCTKICRHADDCSIGLVERDEIDEIKYMYGRKMLTFKEFSKSHFDAIQRRLNK